MSASFSWVLAALLPYEPIRIYARNERTGKSSSFAAETNFLDSAQIPSLLHRHVLHHLQTAPDEPHGRAPVPAHGARKGRQPGRDEDPDGFPGAAPEFGCVLQGVGCGGPVTVLKMRGVQV